MSAVEYGIEVVGRIAALLEAEPEREVCGFVVLRSGALEVVPIKNVADRYHARDPARFPAHEPGELPHDPRAQLRLLEQLEAEGGTVVAVWHSHIEVARISPRRTVPTPWWTASSRSPAPTTSC